MNKIRLLTWLVLFTLIPLLFIPIGVMSPQGTVGKFHWFNVLISLVYFVFWTTVALYAGSRNYKEVLLAAIIYSLYPILGVIFVRLNLMGIGISLYYLWSFPIQGICLYKEAIVNLMIIIQPIVFLLGYFKLSVYIKI